MLPGQEGPRCKSSKLTNKVTEEPGQNQRKLYPQRGGRRVETIGTGGEVNQNKIKYKIKPQVKLPRTEENKDTSKEKPQKNPNPKTGVHSKKHQHCRVEELIFF